MSETTIGIIAYGGNGPDCNTQGFRSLCIADGRVTGVYDSIPSGEERLFSIPLESISWL